MNLTNIAAAIAALAIAAAGWQTVRMAHEQTSHQVTIAQFQGERVEAARLANKAATKQREEFERRIKEKDDVIENARDKQAKADTAARTADAARQRMLNETDGLVARARQSCRSADPGSGGTPADDPIGVLADVFRRADDRAGLLAKYADAARIAGEACERQYNSLTVKP